MTGVEIVAIVLGMVSLGMTAIGFFASLDFYRAGVSAQDAVARTLALIEERAGSIQNRVGGLLDKTLDAALDKNGALDEQFDDLRGQLETFSSALVEEALRRLGDSNSDAKAELEAMVAKELAKIRAVVDRTQVLAEEMQADEKPIQEVPGGLQLQVLAALEALGGPVPTRVLAERADLNPNGLTFAVDSLLRKGFVESRQEHGVGGLVLTPAGEAILLRAEGERSSAG